MINIFLTKIIFIYIIIYFEVIIYKMLSNLPKPPININILPQDIKTKIYLDNFQYDIIYDNLQIILKKKNSIYLNNSELLEYFEKHKLIQNKKLMEFLCNKDQLFNDIYKNHYLENKISFKLMEKLESMCQSWLMYLYH
jgi:hypothetical protein